MAPPNEKPTVDQCARETGTLIKRDSTAFTDYVSSTLHQKDPRWGRKVRRRGDWSSRNADAIAYLWENEARKDLVDIVTSSNSPQAGTAWQVYDGPNEGNGYWMEPPLIVISPSVPPPPDDTLEERVTALEATVAKQGTMITALAGQVQTLDARVTALEQSDTVTFTPAVISTSRVWGHAHEVVVLQPEGEQ